MLASPIIEGTLPAFFSDENGTATIAVPFSMSRAVSRKEVKGFRLKIKPIFNGDILTTLDYSRIDFNNNVVYFMLQKDELTKFNIGTFYKAQLAYIDNLNLTGYYSTVGVIKYTTKPNVSILNLNTFANNGHVYEYTGVYNQQTTEEVQKDSTEKEYSYRFLVTDIDGHVIEDTGFLIHNNSNDVEYYESKDTFMFTQDIEINKKYLITYTVRTNNGLEVSSPEYKLISQQSVMSKLNAALYAKLNYSNGYIALALEGAKNKLGYEEDVTGYYLLSRSSDESNFTKWEEIDRFTIAFKPPSSKSWKDFTIKQGVKYRYSIQQYNKEGLYSERVYSDIIYADFEDSFLFDGERQLKIRFNPKVTSFKKDLLEAKVDTIGSKYPFIFRNGQVEYKEFPISGLISYQMDEEGLFYGDGLASLNIERDGNTQNLVTLVKNINFLPDEKFYLKHYNSYFVREKSSIKKQSLFLTLEEYLIKYHPNVKLNDFKAVYPILKTLVNTPEKLYENKEIQERNKTSFSLIKYNDLVSDNILRERNFKLEVLDWLTNGKPKLFKSATEGNYLVRLMNTSLAPNDQLGRMLHTFTSTAYEIADVTYEALVDNGIISVSDKMENNKYLRISTIPFSTMDINFTRLNDHITYVQAYGKLFATGPLVESGSTVEWAQITDMTPGSIIMVDGEQIMIGSTGSYKIDVPVSQVILGSMAPVSEDFNQDIFNQNVDKKYYIKTDSNIFILADSKYDKNFHYYENDFIYSSGQMTFGSFEELHDAFSQISSTDLKDIIGQQVIGAKENVINDLEDIIKKVVSFYDIKIKKRPIATLHLIEREIPLEEGEEWPENEPRPTEEIFVDEMGNLMARPYYFDKILLEDLEHKNPLMLYKYKYNTSYQTGDRLYCHVQFMDLQKNDEFQLNEIDRKMDNTKAFSSTRYPYPENIPPEPWLTQDWEYRQEVYDSLRNPEYTASFANNPYLKDYRDFELYAKNGGLFTYTSMEGFVEVDESYLEYKYTLENVAKDEFHLKDYYMIKNGEYVLASEYKALTSYYTRKAIPKDGKYFLPEDFEFISDLSEVYITDECYNKLRQTYAALNWNVNDLDNLYPRYKAMAFIGEFDGIDVNQTEVFSTGPMEKVESIQTTVGVYLELFYQQQILNYDISKNKELQSKKATLDKYEEIASENYMIDMCLEKRLMDLYLLELDEVYFNYEAKYNEYLTLLTQYLRSLEQEG